MAFFRFDRWTDHDPQSEIDGVLEEDPGHALRYHH